MPSVDQRPIVTRSGTDTCTQCPRPSVGTVPEIVTRVRWPDGVVQRVYSPSLVVTDHVAAGESYAVGDLVARLRHALTEASDRVRASYGFPCSRAASSLAAVELRATEAGDGMAVVEAFER